MKEKVKTARLSILSNAGLIILKLGAGLLTGSVSILSEAIHSGVDLLAALIAFFSVRISDIPPDKEHPYGHGKFENVSGVAEGLLIALAAGWIIYKSILKCVHPAQIDHLELGFAVMAISALVNYWISKRLYAMAKKTDSIALEADALHLKTDVYTSLGVTAGLILIRLTGWYYFDPAVAIAVSLLILKESFELIRNAYAPLLDVSLSSDENQIITDVISFRKLKFHNLRTRKSGPYRFADLHLEMPSNTELHEVHRMCDEIEAEIKRRIPNIEINIHVEPVPAEST